MHLNILSWMHLIFLLIRHAIAGFSSELQFRVVMRFIPLPVLITIMNKISFAEAHPRAMRLWHWSSFIVIFLLLFTILVTKTFLGWQYTNNTLRIGLLQEGIHLTPEQTSGVGGMLQERAWNWHIQLGYILSLLFGFRVVLEFIQPTKQKLGYRLRNAFYFIRKKA
ncbi:MAG: cytochrome b/b6 domain-containing protein [Flavisolibacter sp.]|nr:cytochrome b/b6 domain-containing protein [Flavisolibacter sp.]